MKHKLKISDIKIPKSYRFSKPRQEKLDACRDYFRCHGIIDRDIVVNKDNIIKDGYIGYLILKENGIEDIDVVHMGNPNTYKNRPTLYVYAHHKRNNKIYTWRMTRKTRNADLLTVGSKVVVGTKHGISVVTVDGFEVLDTPPVSTSVKKVIKCLRN